MDIDIEKIIKYVLFVPLAIIFVPAFIIVTHLNKIWSKWISELFGL